MITENQASPTVHKRLSFLVGAAAMIGTLCFACGGPRVTSAAGAKPPAETALSIPLAAGLEVVVERTAFGMTGGWSEIQVRVEEVQDDNLRLSWKADVDVETAASKQRREAFEANPPTVGVGEPNPQPPEPEYRIEHRSGTLAAPAWGESRQMTPLAFWPEGDTVELRGDGLLWMSPTAFRELRATRATRWGITSSGEHRLLFPDNDEVVTLEADANFHTRTLEINGEPISVQTILAGNRYLEYEILDNPDNPLVLRIKAHTLADWTDVFTLRGPLLKTMIGHEITGLRLPADGGQ